MKSSLGWHRENLKNMRATLAAYEKQADEAKSRVSALQVEIRFLLDQISAAEKKGMDSFDAEKFNRKRSSSHTEG